ncbi:MAG: hypothetical protein IT436_14950, partial [Phycisphaerales bacterium]|nr:hypothetical protein [Phycisphaerales bacterium]
MTPAPGAPPVNPLLQAHRALRGRYALAIACSLVTGLACAAVGWSLTKPLYASQGWIRAFPRQPRVLYETEENQMMPMFDAFVRSQAELLRSRRVIDLAVSDTALRDAGWPAPPEGVQKLIDALDVGAQRGSELIQVTVSDERPQLAQAGANAVLSAFIRYQEEQEGLSATDRERRLRDNQQLLTAELKTIRDSIIRASDQFIGADPDTIVAAKTEQLTRLESLLADPAVSSTSEPGRPAAPPRTPDQLTVEELARADGVLASLLAQRLAIEVDIETAARSLGPDHREHIALRNRFDSMNAMIEKRAVVVRAELAAKAGTGAAPPDDPAAPFRHYKALRDQTAAELRELSRARMEFKSLKDREKETESRLAETNQALEVIRVEDEIIRGGRVRIQQRAPTPIQPTKDRRIPLAAGGFIGGSGSVLGLFVLGSMARRRLRYADELQSVARLLPLIGVIPEARRDNDRESPSIVLSLHHIRNSLLLLRKPGRPGGTVYLLTSAVQGEGKTTVAMALGASFAQAGYRTTLIDCDLVGRGMSRELSMESRPGFVEAIRGAQMPAGLERSRVDGLSVLPAGQCGGDHAHRLTLEGIRPVLDDLRTQSDIVVIDTGPILGSLEVGLLAQLSDAVVIVAARGTASGLVNAAIDRAHSMTDAVSLVFNRA